MYQAPTVKKAFQILDLVARRDNRLTISDLSRELGISKSTVHGITQALEGIGAIVRDDKTRRYTLGMTLLELAHTVYARIDLKDVARPIIGRSDEVDAAIGFPGHPLRRSCLHYRYRGIHPGSQDYGSHRSQASSIGGGDRKGIHGLSGGERGSPADPHRRDSVEIRKKALPIPTGIWRRSARFASPGMPWTMKSTCRESGLLPLPSMRRDGRLSAIWVVGFSQSMKAEKMTAIAVETKEAAEAISRRLDLAAAGEESNDLLPGERKVQRVSGLCPELSGARSRSQRSRQEFRHCFTTWRDAPAAPPAGEYVLSMRSSSSTCCKTAGMKSSPMSSCAARCAVKLSTRRS